MKARSKSLLCTALTSLALTPPGEAVAQDPRWNELANLPFPQNYPTKETADKLRDELLLQRAVQVYLWALPAVNLMPMKEGSENAFGAGWQGK